MSFSRKDIEELKPAIERCAQKLLGSDNSAIVNLALTCLERGYDKKKASSKIATMVGESQANKFTDKLFSLYDDYLNMVVQSEKKRKREPLVEEEQVDNKKTKVEGLEGAAQVPNTFGEFTADKIKEMMANAQKMIQERMNKMNLVAPQVASSVPANQQQALIADASDKLKRANELQARIQARLSSSGLNNIMGQAPVAPMTGPTPVILDEYGRTIDPTTGQAVQLQLHTPTLKANIRAKKREQFRSGQEKEEMGHSKFFDFRLNAKPVMRTKKTFKFFEPGKFEKIGQRMRTKAHLEKLQNEVSLAAKKTGIATAAKLAIIQPKQESPDEVPEVEWWDAIILNTETYPEPSELPEKPSPPSEERNLPIHYEVITNLVEHPIQMKPPVEKYKHIELQTMLTKKERKKMRKQNRSEIQKEYQEKIRLGLLPPPEPKVRMANLMRVLGTEAVQDPTKVEAHVRAQMAKRQKAHEDANAARKLTKEQRREKKIRKIKEDTSNGVVVSVYRVGDLTSPKKKFKVEANANQLFMTGIVILHKDCNVIVVEGGPKQQKKFRKLVMNRMKWGDDKNRPDNDDDNDEEEMETAKTNDCRLIWEGTVKNRAFGEIKIKLCPTEAFAREQFRKHSVEHYWDLAFSSTILETTLSSST